MDVYIAQGHGRRPDGTYDPGASDGIHNEQRDSKPVVESCVEVLRVAGLEVISEAEMVDDPNFYGTTKRANEAKVKCVVSFHYDWNQAPPGAFAIMTTDEGRALGHAIEEKVAAAGFEIRDYPDDRDGLYLLDNTNMPAVIFECGRIGHEDVDETYEQRLLGAAAAQGILKWLGKEDNMALTAHEEAVLKQVVAALDEVGSNGTALKYMVQHLRDHPAGSTVDSRARELARKALDILARIKNTI